MPKRHDNTIRKRFLKSKRIIKVTLNSMTRIGLIICIGPQSRTLQPVRGEGYEPAHKSRANAETHPRLGAGGCRNTSGGW